MLNSISVLTVFCLYMGFLFLTALWVERRSAKRRSPVNNALVYSLSLAVYCTGWTYYGSVGKAVTSGFLFLPIYLGPTLVIILWWITLRKMVRIKTTQHITSIADFISARYDKSLVLGALATLIALLGTMPYIGLQFKAIFTTFSVITTGAGEEPSWIANHMSPVVVALVVVFTIVLGVRRLDPTERHPGLVMAVAAECLVKLLAFLAAGIFVTYFMFDGFTDIFQRISENLPSRVTETWAEKQNTPITWMTYLALAMSAIMFLPRQFHVSVVENFDEKHIKTAMWLFPLYMLLINIFVFPIAMAGILKGYSHLQADTFVLRLPLDWGQKWLTLLVFLGGTSAATGMIMISSITVATMITNHFLLPIIGWAPWLSFLRRRLLGCRWIAVATVILIGFWFERQVGESYMLVNIGIISFAAAFQFAPVILGGIFWTKANKAGATLGLASGFLVWLYTLLLPAFVRSGWMSYSILDAGPWGVAILRPEHLFGVNVVDPLTQGVCWSLFFNLLFYVLGSLVFEQSATEQSLAREFVDCLTKGPRLTQGAQREAYIDLDDKKRIIMEILRQYFPEDIAESMKSRSLDAAGVSSRDRISIVELAELNSQVEKQLAGAVGAASARKILSDSLMFTERESKDLSEVFAEILANLRVTPEELTTKIDYYREREALLAQHAAELEKKVKERTADLETAQEELIKREKLSVLGQLTAVVSHELRNPLGVISFSAFYLSKNIKESDEKIKKHLNRIEEQVGHCDSIIDELLDYTRVKESRLERVDVNSWLENALDSITIPPGLWLLRNLGEGLPGITVDSDKLRRVIINLTENALQAAQARQGSEKSVFYKPTVNVSTSFSGNQVLIKIEDNGAGMSEDTSRKAFDPLFTTKSKGAGLGLAVVKKIVEEHRGAVELSSKINHGTTVTVSLPAA